MQTMKRGRLFAIFAVVIPILATGETGCQDSTAELPGLPNNPGYLRSAHASRSTLTIFDADNFSVYRTVELPPANIDYSHRLELDPAGRIWIGYSQVLIGLLSGGKDRVLVFSQRGDLEHELDLGCGPIDTGVAFANGYAFIGCAASGFFGKLIVLDTNTMKLVKTFGRVHPGDQSPTQQSFYITAVEEVAGYILVIGAGNPPEGYDALTNHSAVTTRIGVIDPETLAFRGYLTGLEPGLRIRSVLEVDGEAWLFNELSHLGGVVKITWSR